MGNKITDYFLRMFPSENEEQGLCVKLPCMSTFAPVLDIYSVPDEPDMLLIMIGSASSTALSPVLKSQEIMSRILWCISLKWCSGQLAVGLIIFF